MSDVARNVELVRRLEQAYRERDNDIVRASVAADLVAHTPGAEMMPPGVEGAIAANGAATARSRTGRPRTWRSSATVTAPSRTSA